MRLWLLLLLHCASRHQCRGTVRHGGVKTCPRQIARGSSTLALSPATRPAPSGFSTGCRVFSRLPSSLAPAPSARGCRRAPRSGGRLRVSFLPTGTPIGLPGTPPGPPGATTGLPVLWRGVEDRADVGILVSPRLLGTSRGSPGVCLPFSFKPCLPFSGTPLFFFVLVPQPLEATYIVGNTWIRFFIISFFFFLFRSLFS